jgi:CBS domain containing-hemolysin-like protein
MEAVFGIIAVLVLVFLNGFFVAAEFALVGSRKTRISQLAAEGSAGAKSAEKAIEHLDSYIAATQLGITLASLGLGWIGEPALAVLFEPLFHTILPEELAAGAGHTIAIIIAFSLVTMLHIILGELAPKTIALQAPEKTAIIVARPTTLFLNVFKPVIFAMNWIGNAVVRLIGFEPAGGHAQVHSVQELHMLVASSGEAGLIAETEEELFHRVFDFGETMVEEIMQPRVEVEALPVDIPLAELLQNLEKGHRSRYPVYGDTIDDVVGVLHTRDLFDRIIKQPDLLTTAGDNFDLKSLLMTPIFVPEKSPVRALLELMQRQKRHLAVVIGEYGGMVGVATMEDILEELVGEVEDEFDKTETVPVVALEDATLVGGQVNIGEIIARFGKPDERVLSLTIGGYVSEQLGRIPDVGDRVSFGDYDVTVDEMDRLRVARLRFSRAKAQSSDGNSDSQEGVD